MIELNSYIDHTLLRPEATKEQIENLCKEAMRHKFRAVCTSSYWTPSVAKFLGSSDVKIATTIGFPHGNCNLVAKILEIDEAIIDEADELDVVLNLGNVKSKDWNMVEEEIVEVSAHAQDKVIKYIIEIGQLNDFEIHKICDFLINHGVNYVKTCTGYGPRGCTIEDIQKLNNIISNSQMKIKASGGIKSKEFALDLINAGAKIIGCSSSVSFMENVGAK